MEIYVKPFPDTGAEYQITQDGGSHPGWSRDSTEIFFRHPFSRNLRVVDVQSEIGFSFGNETDFRIDGYTTFIDSRDYDMTADGRFLMVFPSDQGAVADPTRLQINIVLNWFEELKERVPIP